MTRSKACRVTRPRLVRGAGSMAALGIDSDADLNGYFRRLLGDIRA